MNASRTTFRRVAAVVGVGHTDWAADWSRTRRGERPTNSFGYGVGAFKNALSDAGLGRDNIDGLIAGPHTRPERLAEVLGLNPLWCDQADAGLAVIKACMAIQSGFASVVACVFGYNQRSGDVKWGEAPASNAGDGFHPEDYHAPWGMTSPGAMYALLYQSYKHQRGMTDAELGEVAVAQRSWAHLNSNAIMRKKITIEDYLAARFICEPLRLYDYCIFNDGGVALIIAEADRARKISGRPVYIEAAARFDLDNRTTSLAPRIIDLYLPAQRAAAAQLFDSASIGPADIDVRCVYDSFSPHIVLALEGYGYCRAGDVGRLLREDRIGPGGKYPTNTHGGHLSESYMQGWNHQVESVRQLRGECGARQIERCRYAHYASSVSGRAISIIYGNGR